MAIDRQYFVDEMMPYLRKELPSSVQLPLRKLLAGQSYGQYTDKAAMEKYLDSILPNSVKLSPSRIAAPNAGMYALPERVGLLSAIPGRPDTDVNAVPPSAELMSNTPRDALRVGMGAGEAIAQDRSQGNAISGLLGDINWGGLMDQLIKTFQRPEMLTPGVNALTSFAMSGAGLNQAEIEGAKEQAKLDQAAEQTALENEYRRTRDARDAERLVIAQENARRERLKAPTVTKAKMEAYTKLIGADKITREIVDGMWNSGLGRTFWGDGASFEDTQAAIAAEAISIHTLNASMSMLEAVRKAAKRLQAKASAAPGETKKDRFAPKG